MKFAYVDGKKTEAFAGGRGICRGCDVEVIGRCGEFRIHHWAHKIREDCPASTKEETPWHRQWKEKYPSHCQEWRDTDPDTGERHFADVRTENGLVLEFQNSPIQPVERRSRESFYGSMLWVVNGARLKYDYSRFLKHLKRSETLLGDRWYLLWSPNEAIPKTWGNSSVLVFFDFLGDSSLDSADDEKRALWCLFPGRVCGFGLVAKVLRKEFHQMTTERAMPFNKTPKDVMLEKELIIKKVRPVIWRQNKSQELLSDQP